MASHSGERPAAVSEGNISPVFSELLRFHRLSVIAQSNLRHRTFFPPFAFRGLVAALQPAPHALAQIDFRLLPSGPVLVCRHSGTRPSAPTRRVENDGPGLGTAPGLHGAMPTRTLAQSTRCTRCLSDRKAPHVSAHRRNALALVAALPALAVPAVAAAAVAPLPHPTVAREPAPITAIGKLWNEREAAHREYKAADKIRGKLEREFERRMPKPHPSIVYSAENDVDGLKYFAPDREPHTLHHWIWPRQIEFALASIRQIDVEEGTVDGCRALILRNEALPLTEKQIACRDRLAARLELSRQYQHKIKRVQGKIGLTAINRKIDRLLKLEGSLADRILAIRATTRSDFAAKIAIYEQYAGDGRASDSLVRDLQRMIAIPSEFGRAWAFDPNEEIAKARASTV